MITRPGIITGPFSFSQLEYTLMPKMIPLHTVMIGREGKTIIPTIGKVFDFTKAEVDEITEVNKTALREPINESGEEVVKKPRGKTGVEDEI